MSAYGDCITRLDICLWELHQRCRYVRSLLDAADEALRAENVYLSSQTLTTVKVNKKANLIEPFLGRTVVTTRFRSRNSVTVFARLDVYLARDCATTPMRSSQSHYEPTRLKPTMYDGFSVHGKCQYRGARIHVTYASGLNCFGSIYTAGTERLRSHTTRRRNVSTSETVQKRIFDFSTT